MVCPICVMNAVLASAPLISASVVGGAVVAVKLHKNTVSTKEVPEIIKMEYETDVKSRGKSVSKLEKRS